MAISTSGLIHVVEHIAHELLELAVDLLEGPGEVLGVLAHLEAGNQHATGIGRLAGHERDAVLQEVLSRLERRRHVRTLSNDLAAVCHERLCILEGERVLTSARQRDVARKLPHAASIALVPDGTGTLVDIHGEAHALVVPGALLIVDVLEHPVVDTRLVLDPALGVGSGDYGTPKLSDLLDSVDGDVTRAMDDDLLALEGTAGALEVLVYEVHEAVAGRLGTRERTAEGEAPCP